MESITEFVDKYGQEIAKSLRITTMQVTEKVLWYVRVSGIKDLTLDIIYIIIGVLFTFFSVSFSCKLSDKNDHDGFDRGLTLVIVSALALLVWAFVCFFIIEGTVNDAMKIISPEYWVIDQTINKLMKK